MSSTHPTQEIPFTQHSPSIEFEASTSDVNFSETNSTDSRDSKLRPLKVGDDTSPFDSNSNPIEPLCTKTEDLRVNSTTPTTEHSGVLGGFRKSDSLDSARAACCSRLAFNIYNKALESAKKALPKQKQKDSRYPQFPRSFGEDFGSIGPDAFNYLDDSQTECSGSYKDIDFNRDSYYLAGAIPEERETEESTLANMDEEKPVVTLTEGEPQPNSSYDFDRYFTEQANSPKERDYMKSGSLEDVKHGEAVEGAALTEELGNVPGAAKVERKPSFIGKIFRKRDRSADKEKKEKEKKDRKGKSKKSSSQSRECSMEKSSSSRGQSLPPSNISDTERSLIEELERRRTPSPAADDDVRFSNISRQSPAHLVYSRPPDIFVEECRTLPRNPDELASHTSQMILADVLNQMSGNEPVSYANLDFSGAPTEGGKEPKMKKESKGKSPKRFFKKFGKSKTPEPEPAGETAGEEENVPPPPFQTEEELQEKPLPEVPSPKDKSGKPKRIFLKKDNFKLKDRFKNKKKQKDKMEAYARRQLPTLPESKHSTLNSGHVYDRIVHEEQEQEKLPVDEFGNVIFDIGKPIEPGVDYFSPAYAPEPEVEEAEEPPKLQTLLAQQQPEMKNSYESLEIPASKPASPPPKVVDMEPKPEDDATVSDPEMIPFDSPHPIIIGQIALFERMENVQDREIGVTYEPATLEGSELEGDSPESAEQKPTKMGKLKNMMGSFGQSVRAKVKDIKDKVKKPEGEAEKRSQKESIEKEYVMVDLPMTLKETNLDEIDVADQLEVQQQHQFSTFSYRTFSPMEPTSSPEPEVKITVEEVPPSEVLYEVDADLDDVMDTPEKKKKVFRKFKLSRGKKEKMAVVVPDVEVVHRDVITPDRAIGNEPEEGDLETKPSWSARNKERIRRLRARAAESFKGVKEKISAKTSKLKKSDSRHDPDMYEYEFKFASDSELAPGSGVDSLRRQKVYQELAEAQERLELYMSPVGGHGPLRPPRASKQSNSGESYGAHQSMPSLAMAGRRLPPPPRPPPPKTYPMHSFSSVPAIEVAEDEISLSTSMSSLWPPRSGSRSRSVRATRHQQRVPAEIFYRNVRLGYRPKKSYVELLEKSQSFYSMANLNRSQSMNQLPLPPNRKSKTLLAKRSARATTSPPPPPSRASMASNYGEIPGRGTAPFVASDHEPVDFELYPELLKEKELYEKYDKPRSPVPSNTDPLAWEPFSWKVKRCRSLTEIDVRGEARMKQARCSVEPPEHHERGWSQAPSEFDGQLAQSHSTRDPKDGPAAGDETYSQRIFSWLTSTTSLDTWRRAKRDRSMPASGGAPGKPPRPPPPVAPHRKSRPSSPTSSTAVFFASSASRASSVATLTQQSAQSCSANFAGRPLPPPPIPPRPRLIPAHYAIRTPVEKRDACVDTSENGFLEFHCSEKEVQVKLLSRPGSLASQESRDSVTLVPFQGTPIRPIEETNLDDDDEPTIIGEVKSRLPTQTPGELDSQGRQYSRESAEFEIRDEPRDQETITSATVYMDARSRLTDQQTLTQPVPNHAEDLPHFENDLSDDETINDNISSIASSEYQSFCSSIHSAPPAVPGAGSSWLHNVATSHRQQPPTQAHSADEVNSPRPSAPATEGPVTANTTTTTTEDEYLSAMDGLNAASNRSSLLSNDPMMLEDGELSFEAFQSAFANLTTSSPMAEGEPSSDTAEQRQSSVDLEDAAVSGQASAETKRINRQSVISTVSSTSSSDTSSSSIFHTHSSSPTSSYSFDSSVSLTSIPQAQISITGSTASTGSTFYANAIGAGTSSDADHAERAKEPEVTASTSIDASEPTLESDGCVPSKAASVASTGSNVVVVSPSPQSLPENLSRLPTATPNGSTPSSAYYIAHELWLTERDYVDILKMLTVEFREAIRDTVSTYFLNKFFRPLDQVLPINEMLLNDLQKRVLTDWDDNPKISDIMINVCPFFKEYSIFVREFDQLNHMLDEATEIFPNFTEALNRFQHLERCKKLSIKSYLLKPIQRLPQYPLLLSTYLKKLKPDDGDFENTQRALSVVTKVVEHVNRESHMAEKAMRLAELKNRIVAKAPDAIVKPGRELIKQGLLHKVSRKEVHERFFILFNDVFLYCVPVMNDMIKINEEFPLDGMEVEISNQSESEFVVRSTRRSFALMARNTEERKEWVDALEAAIAENDAKKTSFEAARGHSSSHIPTTGRSLSRRSSSPTRSDSFSEFDHSLSDAASPKVADKELHHQESIQSTQSTSSMADRKNHHPATGLGERAPVWVHDHRVSMCQGCMREFTFLFRRHHCRACGAVVCSDCSSHHYPLKYRKFEPQRVCDNCFETLSKLHPDWLAGEDSNTKGSGSTRVSPNNSLSTADLVNIKQSRSNSCTNLGDSFDWTTDEHNKSLPVPLQDHNHNPTTGILNLSLTRSPIRHSSRFNRKNIPAVLIEVPANDASSKQSGFMFRLSAKKSWKRFWFVIKEMVLYTYKASEDVAALESLPLPGYKVSTSKESIKGQPASLIIELSHPGRSTIYFLTDNPDAHQRWLKAFCECAELH